MTTPSISDLSALREVAEKATPGPWCTFNGTDVYPDDDDREGTRHIADCDMDGAIGGDEQRANAAFIAAFNPQVVIALLDELDAAAKSFFALGGNLAAEKARADAAEAERDELKLLYAGSLNSEEQWIARAEKAETEAKFSYAANANHEATITSLTEQLAEAKRGLNKIATKTPSTIGYYGPGLSAYEAFETARATLSRLEKQEGEA